MPNEHQQRRAMSAAERRHLDPPDDGDTATGTCRICDGDTDNGEEDAYRDEDGIHRSWTWLPCDDCNAACSTCGETKIQKVKDGKCADCAAEESTQTEDTPC